MPTSRWHKVDLDCAQVHKTPVTPEWRPYSVHTAFKNIAERRGVRCANAVETLRSRLERHAAAFTLSMLKTNAAAWRFYS